jgi:predicted nucleic-acid-binding Zn-ribbon protein
MKNSCVCPKCKNQKFYSIDRATLPAHDSVNGTGALTVAAAYLPTGQRGWLGDDHRRYEAELEAWVCATCGYAELYVKELETLAYIAEHAAGVRFIDASSRGPAPFR